MSQTRKRSCYSTGYSKCPSLRGQIDVAAKIGKIRTGIVTIGGSYGNDFRIGRRIVGSRTAIIHHCNRDGDIFAVGIADCIVQCNRVGSSTHTHIDDRRTVIGRIYQRRCPPGIKPQCWLLRAFNVEERGEGGAPPPPPPIVLMSPISMRLPQGAVGHAGQVRGHLDRGQGLLQVGPIAADGGEVIIYALHITEVSAMHPQISEIGYHYRDYFLGQWDRFAHHPWGDLAHSTHLRGQGTWDAEHGERNRVTVTLATGIPEEVVQSINLTYLDPATVDIAAYAADPDTFVEPHAGEILYRIRVGAPSASAGEPDGRTVPTAGGTDE